MRTIILTAALLLAPAVVVAGIAVDGDLKEEQPNRITVTLDDAGTPAPGATVTATYRPGSSVSREAAVGITGADGTLAWTPEEPGLVTLAAQPQAGPDGETAAPLSQNFSIRYDGVPFPGLLVMIVAGVFLYGGVIRGFRLLTSPLPPHPET